MVGKAQKHRIVALSNHQVDLGGISSKRHTIRARAAKIRSRQGRRLLLTDILPPA